MSATLNIPSLSIHPLLHCSGLLIRISQHRGQRPSFRGTLSRNVSRHDVICSSSPLSNSVSVSITTSTSTPGLACALQLDLFPYLEHSQAVGFELLSPSYYHHI